MTRLLTAAALAVALAAPSLARAAAIYAPGSAVCSGEFSIENSGQTSLLCLGDLSISGGEIVSDTNLSIFAAGSLSLDGIRLVGENISLITWFSGIYVSDTVVFDTPSGQPPALTLSNLVSVYTPPLTVVESSTTGFGAVNSHLTFTVRELSPVPEPATWALMLAGVAMLGALRRR